MGPQKLVCGGCHFSYASPYTGPYKGQYSLQYRPVYGDRYGSTYRHTPPEGTYLVKLYLYATDNDLASVKAAEQVMDTITALSQEPNRFLPPDATVWANVRHHGNGMWVLAERSTHVRLFDPVLAGAARINRTCVKFGTSTERSHTDPIAEFRIGDIPAVTSDSPSSTIVVRHAQPDRRMNFIAGSAKGDVVNGACHYDPFTVVDLAHYKAPDHATSNPVEAAHAMVNGVDLMCQGLSEDARDFVYKNLDAFCIDFDDRFESKLNRAVENKHKLTQAALRHITQAAYSRGMEEILSAGDQLREDLE